MGFTIGGKYISGGYYSSEAIQARADLSRKEAQERARKKAQRKADEAKKLRKAKEREERFQEAEEYQKQFNQRLGGEKSENDASSLYEKFNKQNYSEYREEIANRYGQIFHSQSQQKAPSLDRGLGAAHHQKIEVKPKYNRSPLGPLAKPIKRQLQPGSSTASNSSSNACAVPTIKLTRPI